MFVLGIKTNLIVLISNVGNSCCKPPVPKHATLYSYNIFTPGYEAYIECDKGYISGGEDYRKCQTNYQWSGDDTTCTSKKLIFC